LFSHFSLTKKTLVLPLLLLLALGLGLALEHQAWRRASKVSKASQVRTTHTHAMRESVNQEDEQYIYIYLIYTADSERVPYFQRRRRPPRPHPSPAHHRPPLQVPSPHKKEVQNPHKAKQGGNKRKKGEKIGHISTINAKIG